MTRPSPALPCFALLTLALAAPASPAETRLGLFGGTSSFKWSLSPAEDAGGIRFERSTAFAAGVVADVRWGAHFGLRLEPGFVRKDVRVVIEGDGFFEEGSGKIRLDAFEVPLLLTGFLGGEVLRPYVVTGAAAAFLSSAAVINQEGEEEDIEDNITSPEWSLIAGAGLEFGAGRTRGFLEARYSWGLTNLNREPEEGDAELRNRGFLVLAGLTFRLGR